MKITTVCHLTDSLFLSAPAQAYEPQAAKDTLAEILIQRAHSVAVHTPEELMGPSARPLWLAAAPTSLLAETLKGEVDMNLDFDIEHQNSDGSWSPTWTWYGQYPEVWEQAEHHWKSCLTVEILKALKEFGRIEGFRAILSISPQTVL